MKGKEKIYIHISCYLPIDVDEKVKIIIDTIDKYKYSGWDKKGKTINMNRKGER